jgi:hypothetical protein
VLRVGISFRCCSTRACVDKLGGERAAGGLVSVHSAVMPSTSTSSAARLSLTSTGAPGPLEHRPPEVSSCAREACARHACLGMRRGLGAAPRGSGWRPWGGGGRDLPQPSISGWCSAPAWEASRAQEDTSGRAYSRILRPWRHWARLGR